MAGFFGLWHEHRRGSHRGLHEFFWQGNYVLLLNCRESNSAQQDEHAAHRSYAHLKPATVPILEPKTFDRGLVLDLRRKRTAVDMYKAAGAGLSCDEVPFC